MNYSQDGILVARIGKKKIYISDKTDDGNIHKEIKLKPDSIDIIQLIPNPDIERSVLAIFGSSGSGKSFFAKQYCDEYNKLYKKNPIYLFSTVGEDSSIDCVKNLKRINIHDEDFINEDIPIEDLAESMVIFDDCGCITNKILKNKLQKLAELCMEVGRHHCISIIFVNHVACNGAETKKILNECSSITIFLRNIGGKSLKYLLESYLGCDKKEISKIKTLKGYGRAMTIVKSYPKIAFTERCAYTLDDN